MMLNIKDVLTLDDNNKYIVMSSATYENKNYYYLLDVNNNKNAMICYEENDELIKTEINKLNEKILALLLKKMTLLAKELL